MDTRVPHQVMEWIVSRLLAHTTMRGSQATLRRWELRFPHWLQEVLLCAYLGMMAWCLRVHVSEQFNQRKLCQPCPLPVVVVPALFSSTCGWTGFPSCGEGVPVQRRIIWQRGGDTRLSVQHSEAQRGGTSLQHGGWTQQ